MLAVKIWRCPARRPDLRPARAVSLSSPLRPHPQRLRGCAGCRSSSPPGPYSARPARPVRRRRRRAERSGPAAPGGGAGRREGRRVDIDCHRSGGCLLLRRYSRVLARDGVLRVEGAQTMGLDRRLDRHRRLVADTGRYPSPLPSSQIEHATRVRNSVTRRTRSL